MVNRCSDALVPLAAVLLGFFAAGCPRCEDRGRIAETQPSEAVLLSTNSQNAAVEKKEPTEEQIRLEKARHYLDCGENALAMREARSLLDSKDPEILSRLVDIFGWVGRRAMPELEELMSRGDEGLANSALDAWEIAVEEITSEYAKTVAVTNAVVKMSDATVINSMLMHVIDVRADYSLPALEGVIIGQPGKVSGEFAKATFEHITGEPYSSPSRTKRLLEEMND